jgi:hypothetical protein
LYKLFHICTREFQLTDLSCKDCNICTTQKRKVFLLPNIEVIYLRDLLIKLLVFKNQPELDYQFPPEKGSLWLAFRFYSMPRPSSSVLRDTKACDGANWISTQSITLLIYLFHEVERANLYEFCCGLFAPSVGNIYIEENWHSCTKNKTNSWSESASKLHRPSDRRLLAKWLPTFADRGCHMVSVTDPYGPILGFLDRCRYFSIK